jgi:hypothetical protein
MLCLCTYDVQFDTQLPPPRNLHFDVLEEVVLECDSVAEIYRDPPPPPQRGDQPR